MPSLTKLISRSGEVKEKEALKRASVSVNEAPPAYTEIPFQEEDGPSPSDLTAGFANIKLGHTKKPIPEPQECIAHLKLLECFDRLRHKIGSTDGLFGISDSVLQQAHSVTRTIREDLNKTRAIIAEKRWQVYVSRAVLRFERWLNALTPQRNYLGLDEIHSTKVADSIETAPDNKASIVSDEKLPPIDVLMVWHAYMLNPRAYLEDCLRQGRMSLWHCPMPWEAVVQCIDNETFIYDPPDAVKQTFQESAGVSWENTDDPADALVACARCFTQNAVPWTSYGELETTAGALTSDAVSDHFSRGQGYADKEFLTECLACSQLIDHDALCVGKFIKDLRRLLEEGTVMAGSFMDRKGLPEYSAKCRSTNIQSTFPSRLLKAGLGPAIVNYCKAMNKLEMTSIRTYIEEGLKDRNLIKQARGSLSSRVLRDERVAIRRMMSQYWENSSTFALDLVGAVTRQGSFIEKMHDIDWLHSPALPNTMSRLLVKYVRFVRIMKDDSKMAVPTLDVDLAWHTHQLNPHAYYDYTVKETGQFIDHDDKIAETKLSEAFAWTSKTYQKLYGEPYSECTCWYCEATRESHTSAASRFFRTSSATVAEPLHKSPTDPHKSVHISAHNAVKPNDGRGLYDAHAKRQAAELEKYYQKACARAIQKGQPPPKRNDYYYSTAWGYPVYLPMYMPFYGMPMCTPMMYPVNPGCMAAGVGMAGNCCAGTCAAGASGGAACGAGVGGVSGGCGSGGCGGGGGGGGGGGCGGGGGGGGCGGGGGGGC